LLDLRGTSLKNRINNSNFLIKANKNDVNNFQETLYLLNLQIKKSKDDKNMTKIQFKMIKEEEWLKLLTTKIYKVQDVRLGIIMTFLVKKQPFYQIKLVNYLIIFLEFVLFDLNQLLKIKLMKIKTIKKNRMT
jgi:hypothetical protein